MAYVLVQVPDDIKKLIDSGVHLIDNQIVYDIIKEGHVIANDSYIVSNGEILGLPYTTNLDVLKAFIPDLEYKDDNGYTGNEFNYKGKYADVVVDKDWAKEKYEGLHPDKEIKNSHNAYSYFEYLFGELSHVGDMCGVTEYCTNNISIVANDSWWYGIYDETPAFKKIVVDYMNSKH